MDETMMDREAPGATRGRERPVAIQRRRMKGVPGMPSPNGLPVIYVGRGSLLGNPWTVTEIMHRHRMNREEAALWAVIRYREWLAGATVRQPVELTERRRRILARLPLLAGANLACWCALPEPGEPDLCHRAVLLELANG